MNAASRPRVMITLGGGGYENEARMLLRQLGNVFDYSYVTSQDTAWKAPNLPYAGPVHVLPTLITIGNPSRVKAAGRLVLAIFKALNVVRRERPDTIVGVASPICVPLFVWGRVFKARCVFVESITRTSKLTFTARVLTALRLVDRLYVQWPDLTAAHPKAIYRGTIV